DCRAERVRRACVGHRERVIHGRSALPVFSRPSMSPIPHSSQHRLFLPLTVLFTLVSRLLYIPSAVMGFDGPEYINALKLDHTYNVPPPGNIGYVLLGKVLMWMPGVH